MKRESARRGRRESARECEVHSAGECHLMGHGGVECIVVLTRPPQTERQMGGGGSWGVEVGGWVGGGGERERERERI